MAFEMMEKSPEPLSLRRRLLTSEPLWGAVAALLAALTGALISYQAVTVTLSEQAEQSRESRFLENRMEAYSALLRESQAFQLAAVRYYESSQSGSETPEEVQKLYDSTLVNYEEAVAASWQVDLVATTPVREKKQVLASELDEIERRLQTIDDETAAEYFNGLDARITELTSAFASEAALELQAERTSHDT